MGNKGSSEFTWQYLPDIAAFCALIYSSPHRPVADPQATDLDVSGEFYSSIRENWIQIKEKDYLRLPNPPTYKKHIGGLVLDLWRKKDQGNEPDIWILVFRGSDRARNDWWTNLRWITRFIPFTWDQYAQVISYTPAITDSIVARHPNATIITTGHSLGGGLAQTAGYCSPHIQRVYAFNSSPVTGYFSIEKSTRLRSRKGVVIFRIYEKGEGLAYIRDMMKFLWPLSKKDPEIINVECNFTKGDLIKKHSMVELAKKIKREI